MTQCLHIAVRFLDPEPHFHGRGDRGQPEWPPSPMRLFQAVVAANASTIGTADGLGQALAWLESLPAPDIVAPEGELGGAMCLSVPNNAMDVVGRAWAKGNVSGKGDSNPAKHRAMKSIQPTRLVDGDTVHFVWQVPDASKQDAVFAERLAQAAGQIHALGWGINVVVGFGRWVSLEDLDPLPGVVWQPRAMGGSKTLRVPKSGSLQALKDRHQGFLNRIGPDGYRPVPALKHFSNTSYHRADQPEPMAVRLFELRSVDGEWFRFRPSRLMHVAGMVRHLAIQTMSLPQAWPQGVGDEWVDQFVAGHAKSRSSGAAHRQLSYVPLPSVGHRKTDPGIRRFALLADANDEAWLAHVARRLAGQQLELEQGNECDGQEPPLLVPMSIKGDSVTDCYRSSSNKWHSFTPVILPGHDDHKPVKREKLVQKALAQSGITVPCTAHCSTVSRFPKAFSAHKYDREKKPQGFFRPDHLLTKTATHLTLEFDKPVSGPLVIGAGRHIGFGLMVAD